jgi:hypothetical protein
LETLDISFNNFSAINVTAHNELKTLVCNDNEIYGINVNNNAKLETLLCQNNLLRLLLDVSNNLSLKMLNIKNNPHLGMLNVRAGYLPDNLILDEKVTKVVPVGEEDLEVAISDDMFKEYLLENFDANNDGRISRGEAASVSSIDCSDLDISSLAGIEYFTGLTLLRCPGNQLTSIPVNDLTKLETLDCSDNNLGSLDVTVLTKLMNLYCGRTRLTTLYIARNPELIVLDCRDNKLTALNIRRNMKLHTLICTGNLSGFTVYKSSGQSVNITTDGPVRTPSISGGVSIPDMIFEDYLMTNFDSDGNGDLETGELDAITKINCSGMNISTLSGIESFSNLTELDCSDNNLTSLNVSGMTNLATVICASNRLSSINVGGCSSLSWLICSDNRLGTLDVSGNAALTLLVCLYNPGLSTVYMSKTYHNEDMVSKDDKTKLVFQP